MDVGELFGFANVDSLLGHADSECDDEFEEIIQQVVSGFEGHFGLLEVSRSRVELCE